MIVKTEDYLKRTADELDDLLYRNHGNRLETIANLKRYVNEPENVISNDEHRLMRVDKKYPLAYNYLRWNGEVYPINPIVTEKAREKYGNNPVGLQELWDIYYEEFKKKYPYMDDTSIQLLWQQSKVQLLFVYNFGITKQIYDFDDDCLEFLMKNTDVKKIPYQILANNLPMNSFAINNKFECGNLKISQTIIAKVPDMNGNYELGILFIGNEPEYDYVNMFLPLKVDDAKGYEQGIEDRIRNEIHEYTEEVVEAIYKIVPCIVYLCAQNKELRPLRERNGLERNREKHRVNVGLKCEDVGFRLGSVIKQNKIRYASSNSGFTGTGSSKRPHIRSGHFHHYWTGEGRTELTVKFVESTFVHGNVDKAVVHKVKK